MKTDPGRNRRQKKHGQKKGTDRSVFVADECLNCITNHNKNWQPRREGERKSSV